MKKKYVIAAPNTNYNVVFYKEEIGFTEDVPLIPMSMKKAMRICKNSPLSTWIIEYGLPEFKSAAETYLYTFENFIEYCKNTVELEVIETRPSIYTPSEIAAAIPKKKEECGYVIKNDFDSFVNYILSQDDGFYTTNPIHDALIFRKKEEAEFQAKVLGLKTNEILTVQKINLNELER